MFQSRASLCSAAETGLKSGNISKKCLFDTENLIAVFFCYNSRGKLLVHWYFYFMHEKN